MTQALLDLPDTPAVIAAPHPPADHQGFDIGWDHAHHGLVPPAGLLLSATQLSQGWRAAKAVFGRRTLAASRSTRAWLALRLRAWQDGAAFDTASVTAEHIAQIHVDRCPVLRVALGGAAGDDTAAVIARIDPQAGYVAGNLVVMSHRAAQARNGVTVLQALRLAQRAALDGAAVDGLDAAAWTRVAALGAVATPLPFADAARVPLAALPPKHARIVNAAQGLQALLTRQFARPGFSARTRAIAQLLPQPDLRHEFQLFVGAFAPRVIEAGTDAKAVRQALEDAWLDDRVQRRWQHFVLSLGEAATAVLFSRAAARAV